MSRPGLSLTLVLVLLLGASGGCRSAGVAGAARPAKPAEQGVSPWRLAADQLQTQRIFRLQYDGPEGDGSVNLTLRLESESRYQMTAVDRVLKRRVWGLEVEGDRALALDHRAKTYCWYGGEVEISVLPLGPLPFRTLPALLLGRLPLPPAGAVAREAIDDADGGDADELRYFDARGREWRVRLEAGQARSWTLYSETEPKVWWQRDASGQLLSARDEGLQLRWLERVSEPLAGTLPAVAAPAGYLPECGILDGNFREQRTVDPPAGGGAGSSRVHTVRPCGWEAQVARGDAGASTFARSQRRWCRTVRSTGGRWPKWRSLTSRSFW